MVPTSFGRSIAHHTTRVVPVASATHPRTTLASCGRHTPRRPSAASFRGTGQSPGPEAQNHRPRAADCLWSCARVPGTIPLSAHLLCDFLCPIPSQGPISASWLSLALSDAPPLLLGIFVHWQSWQDWPRLATLPGKRHGEICPHLINPVFSITDIDHGPCHDSNPGHGPSLVESPTVNLYHMCKYVGTIEPMSLAVRILKSTESMTRQASMASLLPRTT